MSKASPPDTIRTETLLSRQAASRGTGLGSSARTPMDPEKARKATLMVTLLLIAGAIVAIERPWATHSTIPDSPANIPDWARANPAAPDFAGGVGWLNTPEPIDLQALQGSVVLVDFWTYSCINCIHTFPYLNAWHDRYKDHGLTIVGVHTPEFRFERDPDNIQQALEKYELGHAVVIDNEYDIWKAYHNRYWPAKYLIDEYGRIRYTHFGEGAYDETEHQIRTLLLEAGFEPPVYVEPIDPDGGYGSAGQTPELFAADIKGPGSSDIGNPEGYRPGQSVDHEQPRAVVNGHIYLGGPFFHGSDHVRATAAHSSVSMGFYAGASNFVAGGAVGACVPVFLDGERITQEHAGRDVRFDLPQGACIELDGHRSYDFYAGPIEEHFVVLDVPEGFELYSFAFSREGRR